jgi:hypothetical protein
MAAEETLTIEKLLKAKHKLVFKPLAGLHGEISADTVCLDPRRNALANTLVHELFHAARPLWSENRVRKETSKLWRAATWQQRALVYKAMGKGVVWSGEGHIPDEVEGEKKDVAF